MTWVIKVGDQEVTSDDFTLSELEQVEKQSDVPWSVANPLRSVPVARAFLKVAVARTGGDPTDVDTWTLKRIKTMFDYQEDEPLGDDQAAEVGETIPLDLSSHVSSHGASGASTGRQKKRAASA